MYQSVCSLPLLVVGPCRVRRNQRQIKSRHTAQPNDAPSVRRKDSRKDIPELKTSTWGQNQHVGTDTCVRRGSVVVRLFGGFEISIDGEPIDVVERSQRVIAYLALASGPQEHSVLAARLWPDSNETRSAANLRAARWREPVVGNGRLTSIQGSQVRLHDDVAVDVRDAEAVGWSLVEGDETAVSRIDRLALFAELLPGWYEDWVIVERTRLSQMQIRFAEAYACAALRRGLIPLALDVALRLVAIDGFREASHRLLAAAFVLDGSIHQASDQIDRYRHDLLDGLGYRTTLTLDGVILWMESNDLRKTSE